MRTRGLGRAPGATGSRPAGTESRPVAGWRRARTGLVGFLALAAAWAILAGRPAPAGPGSGEVRVGLPRLPALLDPGTLATAPAGGHGILVSRLVLETLVEIGERGDLAPGLASQWTVSRDGLVWTFGLRPGAHFHNGSPLEVDDVVASLARHLSAEEPRERSALAPVFRGSRRLVREVRRADARSVQVHLSHPFSPLLALLAHPALAVSTAPDGAGRVVGTGPYRVTGEAPRRLVLEATDGRDDGRPRRIVLAEAGDDAAGIAGLAPEGELDAYLPLAPPGWAGLGLQVLSAPSWQLGLLVLRSDRGLTARKPVRRAIALALDGAGLRPALGRWAEPRGAYLPPGAWGAREAGPRAADAGRARQLLAQAGVTEGALTLLAVETATGVDALRVAETIRTALAAVGLKVTVRVEPPETALRTWRQGDADLGILETALAVNDPHFLLEPLLASDAASPTGTNFAHFRSPAVDGILSRASQLGFRPERLRLYQRLEAQIADEAPYVPLYARLQWALLRPRLRGFLLDPRGAHRLEQVRLE